MLQSPSDDNDVVLESDHNMSDDEHLPSSSSSSVPLLPLIHFDDQNGAGPSGWIPLPQPVCSNSSDSDLDDTPIVREPLQWWRDRFQQAHSSSQDDDLFL